MLNEIIAIYAIADEPWVAYIKQQIRHPIKTLFSQITQRFPKSIHAVSFAIAHFTF
jgi:hypothetical protein